MARDVFAGYETHLISYTPEHVGFVAMNPSIHYDGETWRCMVRCINYRLGKPMPRMTITKTTMLELEPADWSVRQAFPMVDNAARPPPAYGIRGYEDARLFRWRDTLWATATCCDLTPRGNRELVLLELGALYSIARVIPLRGMWSTTYQKNWIPVVENERELRFLYSIDQGITIHLNDDLAPTDACYKHGELRNQRSVKWSDIGGLRGSSQAMRYGDGWLVLVHDRLYRSQFVRLDDQMRIKDWTPAFYFREIGIEFSVGCVFDAERDRLVVSFSVKDATVELAVIPFASVMNAMQPVL